eukprot:8297-Heterococcus_DN1.PRE.4
MIRDHKTFTKATAATASSKQQQQLGSTCVLNDQQWCMRCYCCMMCKDIAAKDKLTLGVALLLPVQY